MASSVFVSMSRVSATSYEAGSSVCQTLQPWIMLLLECNLRELANYRHPGPQRGEGRLGAAVYDTILPGKVDRTGQTGCVPKVASTIVNSNKIATLDLPS